MYYAIDIGVPEIAGSLFNATCSVRMTFAQNIIWRRGDIDVGRKVNVGKTFESESHFATGAPASRGSRPRMVTRETWYVEKRPGPKTCGNRTPMRAYRAPNTENAKTSSHQK